MKKRSQMTLDALDHKETCEFIPLSALIPEKWIDWFYGRISEDAPFSWGDNNRTLITSDRLARHCDRCGLVEYTTQSSVNKFMKMLSELGQTYIDLECGTYFKQTIIDYENKKLTTDDYDEFCHSCNEKAMR